MHKFEHKNKSKLDNPRRREVLPPTETLIALGLRAEDSFVDIGCGIGYFTIPAAHIIKAENKVYALDISEEMLEDVTAKANSENIENISVIKTHEYDLKIENEAASFGLMVNVLHEIKDKKRMIEEIARILKESGKIAIIDFEKKETQEGPPVEHRISKEEVISLLEGSGFKIDKIESFSNIFYGIVAIKYN